MAGFLQKLIGINSPSSGSGIAFPKKAKYKSPKGKDSVFDFEDVESSVDTKAAVFETAEGNGTYIQHNGNTSGRFPISAIFHGQDYKQRADVFIASLLEPGVGILTHPSYGRNVSVVPVGEVKRTDTFATGHGQTIVDVFFYETVGLKEEGENIASLFDDLANVSAVIFSDGVNLSNPVSKASFKTKVKAFANNFKMTMRAASGNVARINYAIEDTGDSLARGMDTLAGEPLALARQCQLLIGEPRRQNTYVKGKLDAYNNLARDIFTQTLNEPSKYRKDVVNTFHFNRLCAVSILSDMAGLSVETEEFKTRTEYIETIELIESLYDSFVDWNDAGFDLYSGELADEATTNKNLFELERIIRSTILTLLQKAGYALTTIYMVLDADRTPIDLCFELYKTASDETLDLFYISNGLVGNECILIPKGKEIVYFR